MAVALFTLYRVEFPLTDTTILPPCCPQFHNIGNNAVNITDIAHARASDSESGDETRQDDGDVAGESHRVDLPLLGVSMGGGEAAGGDAHTLKWRTNSPPDFGESLDDPTKTSKVVHARPNASTIMGARSGAPSPEELIMQANAWAQDREREEQQWRRARPQSAARARKGNGKGRGGSGGGGGGGGMRPKSAGPKSGVRNTGAGGARIEVGRVVTGRRPMSANASGGKERRKSSTRYAGAAGGRTGRGGSPTLLGKVDWDAELSTGGPDVRSSVNMNGGSNGGANRGGGRSGAPRGGNRSGERRRVPSPDRRRRLAGGDASGRPSSAAAGSRRRGNGGVVGEGGMNGNGASQHHLSQQQRLSQGRPASASAATSPIRSQGGAREGPGAWTRVTSPGSRGTLLGVLDGSATAGGRGPRDSRLSSSYTFTGGA